jgi:restriction system protein
MISIAMLSVAVLKPLTIAFGGLASIKILKKWLIRRKNNKKLNLNGEWSLELLMALEWLRYEEICKEFLNIKEASRFKVDVTNAGADGGIDLKIKDKKNKLVGFGQCKAYNSLVGVAPIRELYGVMASENIKIGYFFTTSAFSNDAIKFAKDKITLITGNEQIKTIKSFTKEQQNHLYQIATKGDFTTPTCPNCNKKMIKRNSERGEFWGCMNYPKCKNTLNVRKN